MLQPEGSETIQSPSNHHPERPNGQPLNRGGHRSFKNEGRSSMHITLSATAKICLGAAIAVCLTVGAIILGTPPSSNAIALAQTSPELGMLAIVGANGGDLLDSPDGAVLRSLSAGAVLDAVGRSEDSQWVQVTTSGNDSGWIATDSLVLFGIADLPVTTDASVPVEATPTSTPSGEDSAPAATSTPLVIPTATATPLPTDTPSPTPTNSPTPQPTATPTVPPTATPTSTPTIMFDPASSVLAVVRGRGANLLEAPNGDVVQPLAAGATVDAVARTADDNWFVVFTGEGERGWLSADQIIAFRYEELPTIDLPTTADDAADDAQGDAAMQDEDAQGEAAMSDDASTDETDAAASASSATARIAPTTAAPSNAAAATPTTQARRPTPEASGDQITVQVNMQGSRLNIRSAPSTTAQIVGKALPDEVFIALGRNEDASWIQIEVPDIPGGVGWVSSQFILGSDVLTLLPVVDAGSSPAPAQPAPADDGEGGGEESDVDAEASAATSPAVNAAAPVQLVSASSPAGLSGTLVFQQQLGGAIYAYDLDSGSAWHLTGGMDPAISPDGQQVAFTRFGREGGVFVINIDGSNERRLYASDSQPRAPKWSPDGQWILFSRVSGEYNCRLLGPGLCVRNNPFLVDFPLISKDERYLSRIDLNGENFRDLPALNTAHAPDWVENGVVYQATTSLEITYDTPDYEGSAVLKEQVGVQDPDWSPADGRIAFQRKEGSHWEIFTVNPDGSGLQSLTRPFTALVDELPSNTSPAYSPDGSYIAFVSNRQEDHEAGSWHLWVMNADGSNQQRLPIDIELEYAFNTEQMVSWGP